MKEHHHECETVGLTMESAVLKQHQNHGIPCWTATAQIGSIFGAEVSGELTGIGRTKEQALERLERERHKLYETIWI